MRHTFETMGTVVSLEGVDDRTVEKVKSIFAAADSRFSLYRPESELARIASGELAMMDSSVELRTAYADALAWSSLTSGAFSPNRPDGVVDLNGIVKAQAMQSAGGLIDSGGWREWSLNVGGDILIAGSTVQTTGIVDPFDRAKLLCAIELRPPRVAVATSSRPTCWRPRSSRADDPASTRSPSGGTWMCSQWIAPAGWLPPRASGSRWPPSWR